MDSTYFINNQKLFGIRFTKGEESGSIQILADTYQVQSLEYFSKGLSGYPLDKKVTGDAIIGFVYIREVPFISRIRYHFKADNLEYWNEYRLLIQKFNHFAFSTMDYYSILWYETIPFVEYRPDYWEKYNLPQDPDYKLIASHLGNYTTSLEKQFLLNSGKWWIPDYGKMDIRKDPAGFENQVRKARDLVGRLKRFF